MFGESLNESVIDEKVFVKFEYEETVEFNGNKYYALEEDESVKIIIEVKNLKEKDLNKKSEGVLNFNVPIVVK